MKIWFFVLSFMFFMQLARPALSYIEIGEKGDAEATSGEQTTNLYRLNLQGMSAVKKLNKVDDIIARDEALGKKVTVYDVNDLLENDAIQQEKEEQKALLKVVDQILAAPKKLKVVVNNETYMQMKNLKPDVRDRAVAQQLMGNLRGRY